MCKQVTEAPVNSQTSCDTLSVDNREHRRTYMREYMRKRRLAAKRASAPDLESDWSPEFQTLSPTVQAAITVNDIDRAELDFASSNLDTGKLCELLVKALKRFHYGDIRGVENSLICQASTLDRIFNLFVRRACREGSWEYREMDFRIAFRAQSQFRATLATLAAIKSPARVAIVNQANIAHGPQQVNNGIDLSQHDS